MGLTRFTTTAEVLAAAPLLNGWLKYLLEECEGPPPPPPFLTTANGLGQAWGAWLPFEEGPCPGVRWFNAEKAGSSGDGRWSSKFGAGRSGGGAYL